MTNHKVNKIIAILIVSSFGFLSTPLLAGQDDNQRQLTQQVLKSKQILQQAEAAKGAERQKLMGEHMKMMHESMKSMQAMKPKAGMTMQEHEDWINEHQKLMDQMMEQMMSEHHLLMNMSEMPMHKK